MKLVGEMFGGALVLASGVSDQMARCGHAPRAGRARGARTAIGSAAPLGLERARSCGGPRVSARLLPELRRGAGRRGCADHALRTRLSPPARPRRRRDGVRAVSRGAMDGHLAGSERYPAIRVATRSGNWDASRSRRSRPRSRRCQHQLRLPPPHSCASPSATSIPPMLSPPRASTRSLRP